MLVQAVIMFSVYSISIRQSTDILQILDDQYWSHLFMDNQYWRDQFMYSQYWRHGFMDNQYWSHHFMDKPVLAPLLHEQTSTGTVAS